MKFRIDIDIDNDAFRLNTNGELVNILSGVIRSLDADEVPSSHQGELQLRDTNGNTVGTARFSRT